MSKDLVNLCIDHTIGKVDKFSKKESDEVIRKAFVDICGTDKPDFKTFRRHEVELFEIIEEVLDTVIVDGWENNPFFERFVEIKNLEFGDKNEFYAEDRTMLLTSKVNGNHWDIKRQKLDIGTSFSVPTEFYGAAVYGDFMRFLSGRLDFAALVRKVAEAFSYDLSSKIYTSFLATQSYLPAQFNETGVLDIERLREIVDHVEAATGRRAVIAGTRNALNKIVGEIIWKTDEMGNTYNKTGLLGEWQGIELMVIPQVHTKNTFDFAVDNDTLMILPGDIKPIKLVNEGQALIKQVSDGTDNMDMSFEYKFQKKYGIATMFNMLYGMYKIV